MHTGNINRITSLQVGALGFSLGVGWESIPETEDLRLRKYERELLDSYVQSLFPFVREKNPVLKRKLMQESTCPEERELVLSVLFLEENAWMFPKKHTEEIRPKYEDAVSATAICALLKKLGEANLLEFIEDVDEHYEVYAFSDKFAAFLQAWWSKEKQKLDTTNGCC